MLNISESQFQPVISVSAPGGTGGDILYTAHNTTNNYRPGDHHTVFRGNSANIGSLGGKI